MSKQIDGLQEYRWNMGYIWTTFFILTASYIEKVYLSAVA